MEKFIYVGENDENYSKGDVVEGAIIETYENIFGYECKLIKTKSGFETNICMIDWKTV